MLKFYARGVEVADGVVLRVMRAAIRTQVHLNDETENAENAEHAERPEHSDEPDGAENSDQAEPDYTTYSTTDDAALNALADKLDAAMPAGTASAPAGDVSLADGAPIDTTTEPAA